MSRGRRSTISVSTWTDSWMPTARVMTFLNCEACACSRVSVPALTGATSIVQGPGTISFQSTMSLRDAAKAYPAQLTKLGWKPRMPADIKGSTAVLSFSKGSSFLTVVMQDAAAGIVVNVTVTR